MFRCHVFESMSVGRGGALVKSMTPNRRVVVGSTPALAATYAWTLGKSFTYSCLCTSAWNSDTVFVL